MDKDTRAVTWQFADAAYIELARGAKDMASAKGVMDATAEVISFLFENRESYNVRDDGVLEFHDQAKLSHYRTLQFILESETRRVSRG